MNLSSYVRTAYDLISPIPSFSNAAVSQASEQNGRMNQAIDPTEPVKLPPMTSLSSATRMAGTLLAYFPHQLACAGLTRTAGTIAGEAVRAWAVTNPQAAGLITACIGLLNMSRVGVMSVRSLRESAAKKTLADKAAAGIELDNRPILGETQAHPQEIEKKLQNARARRLLDQSMFAGALLACNLGAIGLNFSKGIQDGSHPTRDTWAQLLTLLTVRNFIYANSRDAMQSYFSISTGGAAWPTSHQLLPLALVYGLMQGTIAGGPGMDYGTAWVKGVKDPVLRKLLGWSMASIINALPEVTDTWAYEELIGRLKAKRSLNPELELTRFKIGSPNINVLADKFWNQSVTREGLLNMLAMVIISFDMVIAARWPALAEPDPGSNVNLRRSAATGAFTIAAFALVYASIVRVWQSFAAVRNVPTHLHEARSIVGGGSQLNVNQADGSSGDAPRTNSNNSNARGPDSTTETGTPGGAQNRAGTPTDPPSFNANQPVIPAPATASGPTENGESSSGSDGSHTLQPTGPSNATKPESRGKRDSRRSTLHSVAANPHSDAPRLDATAESVPTSRQGITSDTNSGTSRSLFPEQGSEPVGRADADADDPIAPDVQAFSSSMAEGAADVETSVARPSGSGSPGPENVHVTFDPQITVDGERVSLGGSGIREVGHKDNAEKSPNVIPRSAEPGENGAPVAEPQASFGQSRPASLVESIPPESRRTSVAGSAAGSTQDPWEDVTSPPDRNTRESRLTAFSTGGTDDHSEVEITDASDLRFSELSWGKEASSLANTLRFSSLADPLRANSPADTLRVIPPRPDSGASSDSYRSTRLATSDTQPRPAQPGRRPLSVQSEDSDASTNRPPTDTVRPSNILPETPAPVGNPPKPKRRFWKQARKVFALLTPRPGLEAANFTPSQPTSDGSAGTPPAPRDMQPDAAADREGKGKSLKSRLKGMVDGLRNRDFLKRDEFRGRPGRGRTTGTD